MTRHGKTQSWDEEDDEPRYDDSDGYSDDRDEEEDYQDFLANEFGEHAGGGGSRLTRLQYATVIVLLIAFALPVVLYVLTALTR